MDARSYHTADFATSTRFVLRDPTTSISDWLLDYQARRAERGLAPAGRLATAAEHYFHSLSPADAADRDVRALTPFDPAAWLLKLEAAGGGIGWDASADFGAGRVFVFYVVGPATDLLRADMEQNYPAIHAFARDRAERGVE